jgi:hypothetical protein
VETGTPPAQVDTTKPQKQNAEVNLEVLDSRLREFESSRTWTSASNLLQACIQVEWDASGRFEDVTNKWDEVDPENGHLLRKLPKYDPQKEGFFATLDPRGSRWYRFSRQDYPEWWELHFPDGSTETGKQDGVATPKRVAGELADAIHTRATGLMERFGKH